MRTFVNPEGDVAKESMTLDQNNRVMTNKTVTAYELSHKYKKCVTALVNGSYIGWGFSPDFIRFKAHAEHFDNDISEITYWHNRPEGKNCRYHAMMLIAFGGEPVNKFGTGRISEEDNVKLFTQIQGRNLPKSKIQTITFKTRFDESGFKIKENK